MKAYGGVDVQIHIFLTSALVGGEWSVSRSCRVTPGDKRLGGPQSRSGRRGEDQNLDPNPDPSVVQPVVSRYIDCAIQAPNIKTVMIIFHNV
jgi:hypothetical protein